MQPRGRVDVTRQLRGRRPGPGDDPEGGTGGGRVASARHESPRLASAGPGETHKNSRIFSQTPPPHVSNVERLSTHNVPSQLQKQVLSLFLTRKAEAALAPAVEKQGMWSLECQLMNSPFVASARHESWRLASPGPGEIHKNSHAGLHRS